MLDSREKAPREGAGKACKVVTCFSKEEGNHGKKLILQKGSEYTRSEECIKGQKFSIGRGCLFLALQEIKLKEKHSSNGSAVQPSGGSRASSPELIQLSSD